MFGKNPIEKLDIGDGQTLRIVKGSPFHTIQGEGPFAGRSCVFVRLHGCNLACTFCDTEFSDPADPVINVPDLIEQIRTFNTQLIVITGGEPYRQNIKLITREVMYEGYTVQIETAGSLPDQGTGRFVNIVCSPKTPSIHQSVLDEAVAFKYVISAANEHDTFIPITATQKGARPQRLAAPRPNAPIYLSPMDEYDEEKNKANRRLVAQLAIKYDCIAGLQLHKFLEVD